MKRERPKHKKALFVGAVIIASILLYIAVWKWFVFNGSIANGDGLEKSDWLGFLGSYLSFLATAILSALAIYQTKLSDKRNNEFAERQLTIAELDKERHDLSAIRANLNDIINNAYIGLLRRIRNNINLFDAKQALLTLDEIRCTILNNSNNFFFNSYVCQDYSCCESCDKECVIKSKPKSYTDSIGLLKTKFAELVSLSNKAIDFIDMLLREKLSSDIDEQYANDLTNTNEKNLRILSDQEKRISERLSDLQTTQQHIANQISNDGRLDMQKKNDLLDRELNTYNVARDELLKCLEEKIDFWEKLINENIGKVEDIRRRTFTVSVMNAFLDKEVEGTGLKLDELLDEIDNVYIEFRNRSINFLNAYELYIENSVSKLVIAESIAKG